MHAEIAAAVAREHTPGLSSAAACRLEEFLGRSPTVLELEVYAALLRGPGIDAAAPGPLHVALAPGGTAVVAVASGPGAGIAAALGLAAAGAQPLALLLGLPEADDPGQVAAAERAEVQGLGFALVTLPTGPAAQVLGLAVGLLPDPAPPRRAPAVGDVLIYLGTPTGREGLIGTASGGVCPPPSLPMQAQTMALLRELHTRPGLVVGARGLGQGGLAQAAASLAVGVQILLDAVPRHPVLLHPNELLLAETPARALIVVPADRVDEVLAAAQAQAVAAAAIGQLTGENRLRVLLKPRGAAAARLVCELPLPARLPARPTGQPADQTPLPLGPSGPAPLNPGLAHLRAHAGAIARPAAVVAAGPPTLLLAVRGLFLTPAAAAGVSAAEATRRALAAAVSAVRASGATPVGAAILPGATAGSLGSLAADRPLPWAGADVGLAIELAPLPALPADGLVVVIGKRPATAGVLTSGFPGPGFLVAVLGFDDGDAAHEQAAGEVCTLLIHGGLCAMVQPIADGGLLLALGRACAPDGVGCTAVLPVPPAAQTAPDELLREVPGRYLLAIPAHKQADARILASQHGVPLWPLGRTGGTELLVRRGDGPPTSPFTEVVRLPVATLAAELRPR